MKRLLILFISVLIFNCSSDDSNDDNTPPEETVICEKAISVGVHNITENSASISWVTEDTGETIPSSWIIEIGPQGFSPGNGTTNSLSFNNYDYNNLDPSTSYDVYIKSKCGSNVFGDNVGPFSFTTESSCATPSNLDIYTIDKCGFGISWFDEGESAWEIEYGESGFALGTGTVINTSNTDYYIDTNVSPNTTYEVYVRANCGSLGYSNYTDALVVTTNPNAIVGMYNVTVTRDDGTVFDHGLEEIVEVSSGNFKTVTTGGWEVGSLAPDQGFNFTTNYNEIIVPEQHLFQGSYANIVIGTQNGEVLCNGDLIIYYEISFTSSANQTYTANYDKQ